MKDLELVAGCVRGDKRSRELFLEKYSRLIYTYIKVVVIYKGASHAQQHIEDIFQDIFCSLFTDNARKLRSYQGRNGSTLASWLRQVTINTTIDYLRAFPYEEVSCDQGADDRHASRPVLRDKSRSPAETLLVEEQLNRLKECIESLDEQSKYFLDLHLYQGVSLQDMKEHLKSSRGAVDMYKFRLLNRLRECFKERGFIDA